MTVMVVMTILAIAEMTLIVKICHKAKRKIQKLPVIFQRNQEEHQKQRPELLMSVRTRTTMTAALVMTVMMIVQTMKTGMRDMREMVLTVNSV